MDPLNLAAPDAYDFRAVIVEHDIHNRIREIVADYCADVDQQQSPKIFRRDLNLFRKRLDDLMTDFPAPNGALAHAFDQEIEASREDDDDSSETNLDDIRVKLENLERVAEAVSNAERGRGRDANRAQHLLISGLAKIFEEYSGKTAKKSWWIDRSGGEQEHGNDLIRGPFAEFVIAVNLAIPMGYRLGNLQNLFEAMA